MVSNLLSKGNMSSVSLSLLFCLSFSLVFVGSFSKFLSFPIACLFLFLVFSRCRYPVWPYRKAVLLQFFLHLLYRLRNEVTLRIYSRFRDIERYKRHLLYLRLIDLLVPLKRFLFLDHMLQLVRSPQKVSGAPYNHFLCQVPSLAQRIRSLR